MRAFLPENLLRLADACPAPLYLVGGSVRDFLAGYPIGAGTDWDLSSPMSEDAFLDAAKACGLTPRAVFRHTGTVKLTDGGSGYEFTRFRSDKYVRGLHTPAEISFTEDISCDARRRDFCANAVYYDIAKGEFCDPLGGIGDIRRRILRTVREADRVFGEDGLRLMRLARISAETGFSPDADCLAGAKKWSALIGDIAPERIFSELRLLLFSDAKHGDKTAPYRGLTLLKESGVLARILPELAAGEGLFQRPDFHKYDVLEHSLRCAAYATPEVRFAALLHDVGKPYCYLRDGNFFNHPKEGARIAEDILTRLKAPKALIKETALLVSLHMRDYNLEMKPMKVRREIVYMGSEYPKVLALKQADFSACKDDFSPAPTVVKWEKIRAEMKAEGVPFSLKELAIGGRELHALGVREEHTAEMLSKLWDYCIEDGSRNTREALAAHLKNLIGKGEKP